MSNSEIIEDVEIPTLSEEAPPVVQSETEPAPSHVPDSNMEIVMQIPVNVEVMLGSVSMPVSRLMQITPGFVLTLNHYVGEPVDLKVNGRKIAEGELVVLDDETSRFGVSITALADSKQDGNAG